MVIRGENVINLLFFSRCYRKASVKLLFEYEGTEQGYPYKCDIGLKFKLSDKGFACTTTVHNKGKLPLPLGDGWHPYFKLETETIDNLILMMPPVRYMPTDARKLPSGNTVSYLDFFQPSVIGDTQLDHGFKVLAQTGKASTLLQNPTTNTLLEIWQTCGTQNYDYLQIYTPADRKTIAIEPMTCAADAFNNEFGLITLAPKQHWQSKYGVCMHKKNGR